ncbi:hypothetical protein IMZ48_28860 [Candidatus Bathyarchaeota archaeon]|nr:hypothetical protein [Candidatus Bathyarchaeota archaeon]
MHFSTTLPLATAFLLSAAPLALAGGDFDAEDVPKSCQAVCEPLRQLVQQCDVEDDRVGGDRNEDLLERRK